MIVRAQALANKNLKTSLGDLDWLYQAFIVRS